MKIEIYHNPRWSKSRESVKILNEKNIIFIKIEYIKEGLKLSNLKNICSMLNVGPLEIIRQRDKDFQSLCKKTDTIDEDFLFSALVKFPKILERPILINNNKAVIGRPANKILDIL